MEKKRKLMLTFAALIFLVIVLYFFTNWFSIVTGFFLGESEQDRVAICLTGKNAELYSNKFCKECIEQEKILGNSINKINYIDCGEEKINCPNIREIPSWYVGGEIYYGIKNLDELKAITNC